MTGSNQHTSRVSRARMRQWQKRFTGLLDNEAQIEEDILVSVYEATQEGLSQANIAGMLFTSPSSIAPKAAKGEAILKERKGKNQP